MANPVVHFEILGADGAKLQAFYRDLLGWAIDANNPMNYGIVPAEEGGIGGGVAASQDGTNMVTVYIAVPDLQATLDRAAELGGSVVMPPMEIPGYGMTIAQFTDPEGNIIGLFKGE